MTKERTFYYRRVSWASSGNHCLQDFLDRVHARLSTTQSRTFDYHDGELQGINYRRDDATGVSFSHITYYVPQRPTSLVPDPAAVPESEIVERDPPSAYSFMDGDIFLLIKDNDLILCASGAREGAAERLNAAGASMIASEDEGFTIVTNSGKTLTSEDVKVCKKVALTEHGNSVSCEHAWAEMQTYYNELADAGVLEF